MSERGSFGDAVFLDLLEEFLGLYVLLKVATHGRDEAIDVVHETSLDVLQRGNTNAKTRNRQNK